MRSAIQSHANNKTNDNPALPLWWRDENLLNMTIPALPTVPDREALRALYDEAVKQINPSRPTIDLTTGFYAETGNARSTHFPSYPRKQTFS